MGVMGGIGVTHGKKRAVILTNCPSCVQGLGRNPDLGIEPRHIVVALAEKLSGDGWVDIMKKQVRHGSVISF